MDATVSNLRQQLHTKQYRYSTELLCIAIDNKIQNKGLGKKLVKQSFNQTDLLVFTNSFKLTAYLKSLSWKNKTLLMMSSGNFDGIILEDITS